MTIGQRIAAKRKELGLSQADLGEQMGVSRQSISKWEADAAIPEVDKLIALSKFFSVSVGWLLGVEQMPEDTAPEDTPEPEPDVEERKRWQAVLDKLPTGRQRIVTIAAAVMAAAALILSACSLYRNIRIDRELRRLLSYAAMTELIPAALDSYDFTVTPAGELNRIDCTFTYSPPVIASGTAAELVIYQNGQEYLRQECDLADGRFHTVFSLPSDSVYTPTLVLTTDGGLQTALALHDAVVENPQAAMNFGTPRVTFDSLALADSVLTLNSIHFDFSLPSAFRDTVNPWKACDLVIRVNGQEQSRVDILNRSQYSKQVNFSDRIVNFTTERQQFPLNAADGDTVELVLECVFGENLDMEQVVFTWVMIGNALKRA